MPRIYLAGPTVFAKDCDAQFARLRRLCAAAGAAGVSPLDGELSDPTLSGPDLARAIFEHNLELIQEADAMIADARMFRGLEPDSGTMFEIGYAHALGKPIAVYGVPDSSHSERIVQACGVEHIDGRPYDLRYGQLIESLGLPLNLMIACSAHVAPSAEAAVAHVVARLAAQRPQRLRAA